MKLCRGICEICGKTTRGGGGLCYRHRKFSQYSGFTHLVYKKPKNKSVAIAKSGASN